METGQCLGWGVLAPVSLGSVAPSSQSQPRVFPCPSPTPSQSQHLPLPVPDQSSCCSPAVVTGPLTSPGQHCPVFCFIEGPLTLPRAPFLARPPLGSGFPSLGALPHPSVLAVAGEASVLPGACSGRAEERDGCWLGYFLTGENPDSGACSPSHTMPGRLSLPWARNSCTPQYPVEVGVPKGLPHDVHMGFGQLWGTSGLSWDSLMLVLSDGDHGHSHTPLGSPRMAPSPPAP